MDDKCAVRPRDFIKTKDNLIFSVVSYYHEKDRVLSFLRYVPKDSGFKKVNTTEADEFLRERFPEYLFYSKKFDAQVHAVPVDRIGEIFHPHERLQEILNSNHEENTEIEKKTVKLAKMFNENGIPFGKMGVSGSVLIFDHRLSKSPSDIDLVIYGRENFENARRIVKRLIDAGELFDLSDELWMKNYERRSPSISYDEFLWHEKRKFNKGSIDDTKFDVLFVRDFDEIKQGKDDKSTYKKKGKIKLLAKVTCAKFAFDYPARYKIESCGNGDIEISEVVSFTHTYVGQAKEGEIIEVSGVLEECESKGMGGKRVVVGTTREAEGEYIIVVHN